MKTTNTTTGWRRLLRQNVHNSYKFYVMIFVVVCAVVDSSLKYSYIQSIVHTYILRLVLFVLGIRGDVSLHEFQLDSVRWMLLLAESSFRPSPPSPLHASLTQTRVVQRSRWLCPFVHLPCCIYIYMVLLSLLLLISFYVFQFQSFPWFLITLINWYFKFCNFRIVPLMDTPFFLIRFINFLRLNNF